MFSVTLDAAEARILINHYLFLFSFNDHVGDRVGFLLRARQFVRFLGPDDYFRKELNDYLYEYRDFLPDCEVVDG